MKRTIVAALALWPFLYLYAQDYTINASAVKTEIRSGHLKMGNPGLDGKQLLVNNRYLTLNGIPIIPVMGEIHYTRIPRHRWEETILKMKACGVNIIATYVFWIHHEEIEGEFDWSGNKDLRAFVQLCAKHDLWVYPRIGPWCHGEVRNGATPDWLLLKKNVRDRSNDPVYQYYADRLYNQIALQLKGLLYKDGGPVIGVQLENEYRRGKGGEAHILWLKQTAIRHGIDVPMYTVTGWGNASVPANEVVPLYGAYPDEPWASHLERTTTCDDFRFTPFRDNEKIGNGAGNKNEQALDNNAYPFFTCETGVGIENTNHRRLEIGPVDGMALITGKIGSGSNLPGYYMFAGGSNPTGLLTTLEENKEETGYYNTNPVISYDFQAAIRESGELNGSYYQVKRLHYFLNEFGSLLAPMEPVFPATPDSILQYVVRAGDRSAFVFGMHYCRHNILAPVKDVQFTIQLKNETVRFPSRPVTIPDSSVFIWPVNFSLGGQALLKYATAQPLCHIGDTWVLVQDVPVAPEICLDTTGIDKVEAANGRLQKGDGRYVITNLRPGLDCVITLFSKSGSTQKLVILSHRQAKEAWLLENHGRKRLIVSEANLYATEGQLYLYSTRHTGMLYILDGADTLPAPLVKGSQQGLFASWRYAFTEGHAQVQYQETKALDDAQWLKSNSIVRPDKKTVLFHRFFMKAFSLDNPAAIKAATLVLGTQQPVKVQVNNRWVNQSITAGNMNLLDITGYVAKGSNNLLLAFPFTQGEKNFAARVIIEYFNAQKTELYTDSTWLMKDNYNYPSYLTRNTGFTPPEQGHTIYSLNRPLPDRTTYSIIVKDYDTTNIGNVYLQMAYRGDKASLSYDGRLLTDDFMNGTIWSVGLANYPSALTDRKLQLEINPLPPDAKVYFDNTTVQQTAGKAVLERVQLVPEYQAVVNW